MTVMQRFFVLLVTFSVMSTLAHGCFATDALDLSVELKTLPLLTNKITGQAVVAIIYNPALSESKTEAESLKATIDAGVEAPGGVKLTAILVSTDNLSKLSEAKIGIVTAGGCTDAVSAAAATYGVLTMSSDLECVKANRCIIGVVSRPSVEIYLSKSAADAAKIGFSQAFIMIVKQV